MRRKNWTKLYIHVYSGHYITACVHSGLNANHVFWFRPNHKAATFACQSAPLMGFKFQLNSTKKAFKTPLSVIVRGDGNSLFLYTLKFEKQLQLGQFKQINNPLVLPTMHLSTHNASALAAITTE